MPTAEADQTILIREIERMGRFLQRQLRSPELKKQFEEITSKLVAAASSGCDFMSRRHPKWQEFIDRLQGPEGCNFRGDDPGSAKWDCTSESNRPIARRLLSAMGFTPEQIELSLLYFNLYGGYCDCEIVWNVYLPTVCKGRSGKNPRKRT